MLLDLERERPLDRDLVDPGFRRDVLAGLALPQKAIPARWFYDRAGSELFEAITELPEYYPTRVEIGLLERHAREIGRLAGPGRVVVEFGSGSSTKTPHLLGWTAPAAYVPVDISGEFLRDSAAVLAGQFPGLPVIPVEHDFTQPLRLPDEVAARPRLGFFPGSTIGNFAPAAAVDLLRAMAATLGEDALLLIGIDRVKDKRILIPAYNDAAGVTAAFNLNLLARINRELGADFDLRRFRHYAFYNAALGRIEMHLISLEPQVVRLGRHRFRFATGESLHTENSYKYSPEGFGSLAASAGFRSAQRWTDRQGLFGLFGLN